MNGNNIWSGTDHPEQTWKWVSYMGSEECQTTAATFNGSFFPSIAASMQALVDSSAKDGLDLSVFGKYQANGELFPAPAYNNGSEMESEIRPKFEAFFLHQENDELWPALQKQTKTDHRRLTPAPLRPVGCRRHPTTTPRNHVRHRPASTHRSPAGRLHQLHRRARRAAAAHPALGRRPR